MSITPEEAAEAAAALLLRYAEDRTQLAELPESLRVRLLVAAGRFSRPDKREIAESGREHRKARHRAEKAADRGAIESSGLRRQRQAPVYAPLWLEPPPVESAEEPAPALNRPRACYVCKSPYTEVHAYYDAMCRPCGDLSYQKRTQTADLRGRIAVVTGGRVKIGFQCALILLRAGGRVIVTTRFPHDAATRFAAEPDFSAFAERLSLVGLDLRHSPSVERFCAALCAEEPHLDLLVNNACQTIRRPPGFYAHLLEGEQERPRLGVAAESTLAIARYTPVPAPSEDLPDAHLFPVGQLDEDRQQVDLRTMNSWRLKLADVATPELLEVHLVNAIAPFILNGKLKPLFLRHNTGDRHIVNVSAMEGQFYRTTKTDRHPHTNMAKAALNMLTRTSAPDYRKDGIYMNAVDTGWITDEDPTAHVERKVEEGFQPPLDILDGAARVLDPFLNGLNTGTHVWGQFLKNYRPSPW